MRAMGYDLHTAISDLIDNSIFAGAKNISIDYDWNDGSPWVRITDDGKGMDEVTLKMAMKPGSKSPEEERESEDLGRFGLGLKTASWSQCKLMTVMSKMEGGQINHRQWDLDYVVSNNKWELLLDLDKETEDILSSQFNDRISGTSVLWQNLDRIIGYDDINDDFDELCNSFNQKFTEIVLPHLEMTFHRFLSGKKKININVGRQKCIPWDPFLSSHEATEERTTETFDSGTISVIPFILPHTSHLNSKELDAAKGPGGWSKQQGFYVYRNQRMIISGGYLGLSGSDGKSFEAKDHFGLCRIRVDLPNDTDHEWSVDVRKASACPPMRLRREFERIAISARNKSSEVFRRRTVSRKIRSGSTIEKSDIWNRKKVGSKTIYRVNRKSPAIEHIRSSENISKKTLNSILHLIERTVPYRGITVDNNELTDATVDLHKDESAAKHITPPKELIEFAIDFVKDEMERGKGRNDAIDYACKVVFRLDSGEFRAAIEKAIKEGK